MSYHVLIVDDDPAICKLLSKVMISNEMDPLVVNSGAAALDLIARQSSTLDMILMDITLGDMEGFDVIQTIRRNGVTTPVIIISGRNEDYDFMYGLSLGARRLCHQALPPPDFGRKGQGPHPPQQELLAGEQPADQLRAFPLRHHHHALL